MMKRGQAALEFLMTYGWAILVVIIVIGALAAFGVFDVSRLVPDKCVLPTQLSCQDFGYVPASGIQIDVLNGLGRDVNIASVELIDKDTSDYYVISGGQPIQNQRRHTFVIGSAGMLAGKSGKYRYDIVVNYSFPGSGIPKTIYGDMALTYQG